MATMELDDILMPRFCVDSSPYFTFTNVFCGSKERRTKRWDMAWSVEPSSWRLAKHSMAVAER